MIIETDSAPATATGVSGLIDVHSHFPATAHRQALERAGTLPNECALPVWNPEQTLDVLGDVGIDYAVLSPGPPPPLLTDVDDARRTAREFNEELADQIADDPATYGGVAFLPLPHVDAALEELAYALDVLKLEGAHVFTHYRGHHPGDAEFAPLLEELDRRRTTVITHPTSPHRTPAGRALRAATPEFADHNARLVSSLLGGGALDRYPAIVWVLAHGGVAGHDPVRGFHVDVVGHVDGPALGGLAARHGPAGLLFGTGMPAEQAPRVARDITTLMTNDAVGDDVRQAIARDNALRLFPSVARKLRVRPGG